MSVTLKDDSQGSPPAAVPPTSGGCSVKCFERVLALKLSSTTATSCAPLPGTAPAAPPPPAATAAAMAAAATASSSSLLLLSSMAAPLAMPSPISPRSRPGLSSILLLPLLLPRMSILLQLVGSCRSPAHGSSLPLAASAPGGSSSAASTTALGGRLMCVSK